MPKGRMEAFSDSVIAVAITIMVLELHAPHAGDLDALRELLPGFLAYAMSFTIVGIYWVNHHHLLHLTGKVTGGVMWANLHLLFWLTLVPFTTAWMGEHHREPLPTAIYGAIFLACGVAYQILEAAIVRADGAESKLGAAIGRDLKGKASGLLYASSIPLAWIDTWISDAVFVIVAAMWFVPDRRIERHAKEAA